MTHTYHSKTLSITKGPNGLGNKVFFFRRDSTTNWPDEGDDIGFFTTREELVDLRNLLDKALSL